MLSHNISIHFCDVRKIFRVQFGQGHIFLCGGRILQLMMNIRRDELELFHRALFYSYNGLDSDMEEASDQVYQLDFGMVLVRLSRTELCFLLMKMWQEFFDVMESVVVLSDSTWLPNRYAIPT